MPTYIEGFMYPTTHVRLVLVRRSNRGYPEAIVQTLDRGRKLVSKTFPGGEVEAGENPIRALSREVSEEGIMTKFERDWAEYLWEHHTCQWRVDWRNKGLLRTDAVFMAEWYSGIYSGMLYPQDPEIKSVGWQNLHEIVVDRRAPKNMQVSAGIALKSYIRLINSNRELFNLPLWPDDNSLSHHMR